MLTTMQRQTIPDHVARATIEQLVGRALTPEDKVSGGPIVHFRSGWAKPGPTVNARSAHYFRRDGFNFIVALCGFLAPARHVFGAGNFPHCGHCTRTITRLRKRGWWKP